jgi:hypothetical protein
LVKQWGLFDINERLIQQIGNSVISGPFQGLMLTAMARQEHVGPYVLGTYEMELHPWWRAVLQQRFTQIIDVGASFGYYAVGLAQRFPNTAVRAFDIDPWAQTAIAGMAAANNVSNVSVHKACSPAWLRKHQSEVPALETATLIVELHETLARGVSSAIVSRFSITHTMEQAQSRATTPLPLLPRHTLTDDELMRASTEVRPQQAWMFLRPKRRISQ